MALSCNDSLRVIRDGQERAGTDQQIGEPFFLWQSKNLGNACGTIASIHALLNSDIKIPPETPLGAFAQRTLEMHPCDRGVALEADETIRSVHAAQAQEGQTDAAGASDDVDYHFVCFVHTGGKLWELDGLKGVNARVHALRTPLHRFRWGALHAAADAGALRQASRWRTARRRRTGFSRTRRASSRWSSSRAAPTCSTSRSLRSAPPSSDRPQAARMGSRRKSSRRGQGGNRRRVTRTRGGRRRHERVRHVHGMSD
jgi:hypothetical protein